jgi:PAS domain S-box-containing protein
MKKMAQKFLTGRRIPSLRVKLVCLLCAVSFLPMLMVSRVLIELGNRSTRTLRELQVKEGLEQTFFALQDAQERLLQNARTLAAWEDLIRNVRHPDINWLRNNLEGWAPQSYQLDFLAVSDPSGRRIYSWFSSPGMDADYLKDSFSNEPVEAGILSTPQSLYILAKSDITADGMKVGKLIFGRKISHRFLLDIRNRRDQDLMVYYGGRLLATTDTTGIFLQVDPSEIFTELIESHTTYLYYLSEKDQYIGFQAIRNADGIDVAALGWTSANTPAGIIQESINKTLLFFGIPLLLLIAMAALTLGIWIEHPIRTLSKTMVSIRQTGDLSQRVPVIGGGEIASMSISFNQMLEQLSRQREELLTFRTMILAMKEGVLIEDADHRVTFMNPRMEELLGWSAGTAEKEWKPIRISEMILRKQRAFPATTTNPDAGSGFSTEEVEWIRPDGRRIQALRTSCRLEDPSGKFVGTLSTFVDITERNDLELELIQASRMAFLGVYFQGILHNLNGPLNSILGFSTLLTRSNPDAEIPARILQDSQRMMELITSIGRRWRRTGDSRLEWLDLNEILREELRFLEADLFFKHNVQKHLSLDEQLPKVYGVYGDYSHAFINILINSIEALAESAVHDLYIRSYRSDEEIILEIEDTGIGIKPEEINLVFLPFFSSKNRNRKDGIPSGAGLGLPIARKVLEPYGVKFEIRSEPRKGTCMTLRIPLSRTPLQNENSAENSEVIECLQEIPHTVNVF